MANYDVIGSGSPFDIGSVAVPRGAAPGPLATHEVPEELRASRYGPDG